MQRPPRATHRLRSRRRTTSSTGSPARSPSLRHQKEYVPSPPGRPTVTLMATHQAHGHNHGHVHIDEADWEAFAAHTELEGELLLSFVTDSADWIAKLRGPGAPPVRRVLDIGSGPGVGTCELARLFPDAHVVAIDNSPAMLDRARRRALAEGLDPRISTLLAEVPGGLEGLEPAD